MARDRGQWTNVQTGIGVFRGLYAYQPNVDPGEMFAGEFIIDTGYDDPVSWTVGVQAAEVYAARVYPKTGIVSAPGPGASQFAAAWRIAATPVWSINLYQVPAVGVRLQRVLIACTAYARGPWSAASGQWQELTSVDWTLYRV